MPKCEYMNIFVLHEDPQIAATMVLDKHAVKMPTESMQMICTNLRILGWGKDLPMKSVMHNHPCTIWARDSKENFLWLWEHCLALSIEYSKRYYGRVHKIQEYHSFLLEEGVLDFIDTVDFPKQGLTDNALAMPDKYRTKSPVESYRAYYIGDKAHIATWKLPSKPPLWWPNQLTI